jgi:hypothetical protein
MPDITKCSGEGCEMKERCFRYLSRPSLWQSYFLKPPIQDGECVKFWEVIRKHREPEEPFDNLVD